MDLKHVNYLTGLSKEFGINVTSTTGDTHNTGSKHFKGLAIDIDHTLASANPEKWSQFTSTLSSNGYRVVDERVRPKGQAVWTGPHFHIEYVGTSGQEDHNHSEQVQSVATPEIDSAKVSQDLATVASFNSKGPVENTNDRIAFLQNLGSSIPQDINANINPVNIPKIDMLESNPGVSKPTSYASYSRRDVDTELAQAGVNGGTNTLNTKRPVDDSATNNWANTHPWLSIGMGVGNLLVNQTDAGARFLQENPLPRVAGDVATTALQFGAPIGGVIAGGAVGGIPGAIAGGAAGGAISGDFAERWANLKAGEGLSSSGKEATKGAIFGAIPGAGLGVQSFKFLPQAVRTGVGIATGTFNMNSANPLIKYGLNPLLEGGANIATGAAVNKAFGDEYGVGEATFDGVLGAGLNLGVSAFFGSKIRGLSTKIGEFESTLPKLNDQLPDKIANPEAMADDQTTLSYTFDIENRNSQLLKNPEISQIPQDQLQAQIETSNIKIKSLDSLISENGTLDNELIKLHKAVDESLVSGNSAKLESSKAKLDEAYISKGLNPQEIPGIVELNSERVRTLKLGTDSKDISSKVNIIKKLSEDLKLAKAEIEPLIIEQKGRIATDKIVESEIAGNMPAKTLESENFKNIFKFDLDKINESLGNNLRQIEIGNQIRLEEYRIKGEGNAALIKKPGESIPRTAFREFSNKNNPNFDQSIGDNTASFGSSQVAPTPPAEAVAYLQQPFQDLVTLRNIKRSELNGMTDLLSSKEGRASAVDYVRNMEQLAGFKQMTGEIPDAVEFLQKAPETETYRKLKALHNTYTNSYAPVIVDKNLATKLVAESDGLYEKQDLQDGLSKVTVRGFKENTTLLEQEDPITDHWLNSTVSLLQDAGLTTKNSEAVINEIINDIDNPYTKQLEGLEQELSRNPNKSIEEVKDVVRAKNQIEAVRKLNELGYVVNRDGIIAMSRKSDTGTMAYFNLRKIEDTKSALNSLYKQAFGEITHLATGQKIEYSTHLQELSDTNYGIKYENLAFIDNLKAVSKTEQSNLETVLTHDDVNVKKAVLKNEARIAAEKQIENLLDAGVPFNDSEILYMWNRLQKDAIKELETKSDEVINSMVSKIVQKEAVRQGLDPDTVRFGKKSPVDVLTFLNRSGFKGGLKIADKATMQARNITNSLSDIADGLDDSAFARIFLKDKAASMGGILTPVDIDATKRTLRANKQYITDMLEKTKLWNEGGRELEGNVAVRFLGGFNKTTQSFALVSQWANALQSHLESKILAQITAANLGADYNLTDLEFDRITPEQKGYIKSQGLDFESINNSNNYSDFIQSPWAVGDVGTQGFTLKSAESIAQLRQTPVERWYSANYRIAGAATQDYISRKAIVITDELLKKQGGDRDAVFKATVSHLRDRAGLGSRAFVGTALAGSNNMATLANPMNWGRQLEFLLQDWYTGGNYAKQAAAVGIKVVKDIPFRYTGYIHEVINNQGKAIKESVDLFNNPKLSNSEKLNAALPAIGNLAAYTAVFAPNALLPIGAVTGLLGVIKAYTEGNENEMQSKWEETSIWGGGLLNDRNAFSTRKFSAGITDLAGQVLTNQDLWLMWSSFQTQTMKPLEKTLAWNTLNKRLFKPMNDIVALINSDPNNMEPIQNRLLDATEGLAAILLGSNYENLRQVVGYEVGLSRAPSESNMREILQYNWQGKYISMDMDTYNRYKNDVGFKLRAQIATAFGGMRLKEIEVQARQMRQESQASFKTKGSMTETVREFLSNQGERFERN